MSASSAVGSIVVREASVEDAESIVRLMDQLGYCVAPEFIEQQTTLFAGSDRDHLLVATIDATVVGVLSLHITPLLHIEECLGRITALVVDEGCRSGGVGGKLVDAAESIARSHGCAKMEVTSNVRRTRAHAFYLRCGYEETPKRFTKMLARPM